MFAGLLGPGVELRAWIWLGDEREALGETGMAEKVSTIFGRDRCGYEHF